MIRALTTPSTAAKTAEIMSRYRPIAPKPDPLSETSSEESQRIEQSPYLRNVWANLQARPTRTRKRGRAALPPPLAVKRPRPGQLFGFTPPCFITPRLPLPSLLKPPQNQINLPLLHPQTVPQTVQPSKTIDLNKEPEVPEERDLITQLEGPIRTGVIAPQPVRPVGSSIIVNNIRAEPGSSSDHGWGRVPKKKVEEEIESEVLPAVVSDSSNRVRLANSAYREMVGQPECSWLGSVGACKRICGEIGIRFLEKRVVPVESNRFSCWVTIQWGRNEENRSVRAFCKATRLACESKDYLFAWRFHAGEAYGYGSGPGSGWRA